MKNILLFCSLLFIASVEAQSDYAIIHQGPYVELTIPHNQLAPGSLKIATIDDTKLAHRVNALRIELKNTEFSHDSFEQSNG